MLSKLHYYITLKPIHALLITGLMIRLMLIVIYWHVTIFPDSEGYIGLADLILNNSLAGYTGERAPGYPLLLCLAGNNLAAAVVLQMFLGLAGSIYIYKTLLITGFRKNAAVYIALTLSNLIHALFYEAAILCETLSTFFIILIFYKTFKLFIDGYKGFGQVALLGFLLGYLTFIKPFYFYLPVIIYGLYILQAPSFKRLMSPVVIVLIIPCLAFFGWSYVNKVNTGYFVSTTYYGLNLSQNCVWFAENVPKEYRTIGNIYAKHREWAVKNNKDVAMSIWYAKDELQKETGLSFIQLSDLLGRYSKAAIQQNKLAYAKQVFISWRDFWDVDIYWNYSDFNIPFFKKLLLIPWYLTKGLLIFCKVLFIAFTPLYLYRFFKQRTVTPQVLIYAVVMAAALAQALIVYGTNSRFSFPFEVLIVISVLMSVFSKKLMDKA